MPKLTDAQIKARLRAKFGDRTSRTGGKGAARRKFKAAPKQSSQDDKRLSSQLKRLNVSAIPAIEEVNLFKDDGSVIHFTKPKVQAEIASNTYVVTGQFEVKQLTELIPDILPQLGDESIDKLKHFASQFAAGGLDPSALGGDGDIPKLVDANFEAKAMEDEQGDDNADEAPPANGDVKSEEVKPEVDGKEAATAATGVEEDDKEKVPDLVKSTGEVVESATGDAETGATKAAEEVPPPPPLESASGDAKGDAPVEAPSADAGGDSGAVSLPPDEGKAVSV